ncbi:MAG: hypothetical protein ACE5PT_08715 [Gemmatimonadales bacterium]
MRIPAVLMLLPTAQLAAQASTDIYLVSITTRTPSPGFGRAKNITARSGYDNQPFFTPDGHAILYTSMREGQADTYRYDVARGTTSRVTATRESEYSPTIMPGDTTFSVVRVEMDSTQRLWLFDLDGSQPRLLLENVKPVGYHAWGDENTVALFVLGDPPTLQLADTRTGETRILARDIGRSLHKVPGRAAISFLHRVSANDAWISELDLEWHTIRRLIRALPQNEFYAWMPDGTLVTAAGSKLFTWKEGQHDSWREAADFADVGIGPISRIAVSPEGDMLALVSQH